MTDKVKVAYEEVQQVTLNVSDTPLRLYVTPSKGVALLRGADGVVCGLERDKILRLMAALQRALALLDGDDDRQ